MGYTVSKFETKEDDKSPLLGWGLDQDLLTSPQFNAYYEDQVLFEKYCGDLSISKLKKPPIVSYFEKKQDSDILYSHPDYIHKREEFDNLANINEYKRIPQDSINKWYENGEFHNAFYESYIYSIYKKVGKKEKKTYESLIDSEKKKIEEEIRKIQRDDQLKEKYIVAKMMLNNINSMKLENLKEVVDWANVIGRDAGCYLESSYSLIFLFRYDLYGIYSKIEAFFKSDLKESEQLDLCKIVYYVSIGFKFFHGLLYLGNLLERFNLEGKFYQELDFSKANTKMEVEFLMKDNNYMELVDKAELTSLSVDNGTSGAMSNDFIFIYNAAHGLSKLRQVPTTRSDKYVMVKRNSTAFGNKPGAIFSYNNTHVLHFNSENFKNGENLFEIYDDCSLQKAENYQIECDDAVKKIIFTKSIEHLKPKITVEGTDSELFTHRKTLDAFLKIIYFT